MYQGFDLQADNNSHTRDLIYRQAIIPFIPGVRSTGRQFGSGSLCVEFDNGMNLIDPFEKAMANYWIYILPRISQAANNSRGWLICPITVMNSPLTECGTDLFPAHFMHFCYIKLLSHDSCNISRTQSSTVMSLYNTEYMIRCMNVFLWACMTKYMVKQSVLLKQVYFNWH